MWLGRIDSDGNLLWNRTFIGNLTWTGPYVVEITRGLCLIECNDGGYAVAGWLGIYEPNKPEYESRHVEMWLVRTDDSGNHMWNRTYGHGVIYDLVECLDGGFALFGDTERIGVIGNDDFYLARTDSDGNILWNYTYGGIEADLAGRNSLVLCDDSGFAMLGVSYSFGPDTEILLVRTDSSGGLLWNQTFGGPGRQAGTCLLEYDSGFMILGTTASSGPWIIHTDADGKMKSGHEYLSYAAWHRVSASGFAESMIRCSNGGYAVAGQGFDGSIKEGGWLLRIDDHGYYQWDQHYPRTGGGTLYAIVESSDGGFVMAGTTEVEGETSSSDMWILRVADQPTIPSHRIAAGALGAGFALILGVFVLRRRDMWPSL